ncbi:hypothetical protein [Ruminiclostridium cellobioparum]|uniref:hypothetical protein n=1 Tax=Ruminiclostridium cellobioparum TaxID=29355 RepID=UPI00034AE5E2|nr:hypothetical protein [Ruminiclostridium cellobioparum]
MNWELIVSLWYNYNCMLINLIEGIDSDKLQNVWVKNEEAILLEEVVNHYYKHVEMHMELSITGWGN